MKRLMSTLREIQIVDYAITLLNEKNVLVEPKRTASRVFPIIFVRKRL